MRPREAESYAREQERHIKLYHIKLCPVTSVTGPPGRYPDKKIYVPWVPRIAHKSLTPGLPVGRTPWSPQGHHPKRFMFIRKRAEYCFESTVSEKRTHWASLSFGANSVSSGKNSVSSPGHTNNRLRGTHWVLSLELGEGRKTHWVRRLKPYSPTPYSARFRFMCLNLSFLICFSLLGLFLFRARGPKPIL